MARCIPASADTETENLKRSKPSAYTHLRVASLVFFAGAFLAVATVVAARVPGSQAAYGPPSPPEALQAAHALERADSQMVDGPTAPARTSSTVTAPMTVASFWSMSPLPEGEGGAVTSSTGMSPLTPTSSAVASPQ